ncbi:putative cytochrome P450 hydroxylase [Patulibacter medicamentivorans]|jgi:cytochrome P450|uniref:Putative cytochrome P450 hydroxylase n=1 Tax=Patulibacter medicamentivorans TaxID=1097667 RepID=H0E7P8_9ACTN|nr:cytochrome P450 [Patulibacter medicamentivorans]EHN10322.1 putative cytochrome P450 hydroxylase [Patulibacter medicamentivorans]
MSTTTPTPHPTWEPELDLGGRAFWERPFEERERAFARLRREAPVSFHRPYESSLLPPTAETPGFWAITKWEDCRAISRDAATFVNGQGVLMEDMPEVVTLATTSFLAMDGAEHRQVRGIVSQAFTPRNVRKIEGWIREVASELVDEIIDRGEGDIVDLFAKQLPGRIFAHFFGVERDSEEQHVIMEAAERMLAWDDPNCALGRDALTTFADEAQRIQDIAMARAEHYRGNPAENLVSWVVNARFEDRVLEDWEVAAFFSLLGSAANDTTRHSIGHAIRLFHEHPDQLEILRADLEGRADSAVEEILRYVSPVMHFRRTCVADTRIRGVDIRAGDKCVLWYCSGNRDEEVFDAPGRFDVLRTPNRHLGFGAGGPHFCIGAALGRQMIKSSILELYTRMPRLRLTAEPTLQVNNFIHGIHAAPAAWT